MKCKRYLKSYCLLLVLLLVPVLLADVALTPQYLTLRNKLTDLKKESELVTEQLKAASENLRLSQEEAKRWEETSMTLSNSLTSITQQYNDCFEQLVTAQTKIRILTKTLISLISVLGVMILGITIVLYLELTHKTNFI